MDLNEANGRAMTDEIADLRQQLAEARARNERTYCAYCGHEEPIDGDGSLIAQHIATCEKHPMRAVEVKLAASQKRCEELSEAIKRSGFTTQLINQQLLVIPTSPEVMADHVVNLQAENARLRQVMEAPSLKLVLSELEKARRKFPTWPTDPLHAIAVVGEEFGELIKAVLQVTYEPHKTHWSEVEEEAVQTAAMAMRFVESLARYELLPCPQHEQRDAAEKAGEE